MSVFDDLVGQEPAVAELQAVLAAPERMAHAWLFTGPPGSGRSVAARAFAAALQCTSSPPGCGHCEGCHTALAGSSANVRIVTPPGLSYGVKDTRGLVLDAAMAVVGRGWRVIILEDADRLTESAANALLKAIEEPTARTVWLLCVPSPDDLVPTVRSRCRVLALRIPPAAAVADVLVRRDGADPAIAAFAARAAQGHVGRARRLARDEEARRRRREVLGVPLAVGTIGSCFAAAAALVEAADEEAALVAGELDEQERLALRQALGDSGTGKAMPRGATGQLKELEEKQKRRATRGKRDALDRALTDLASFYRDVLTVQLGAGVELANTDLREQINGLARAGDPESTLRRIDAVLACREAIAANVHPLLAVEAMTLALHAG